MFTQLSMVSIRTAMNCCIKWHCHWQTVQWLYKFCFLNVPAFKCRLGWSKLQTWFLFSLGRFTLNPQHVKNGIWLGQDLRYLWISSCFMDNCINTCILYANFLMLGMNFTRLLKLLEEISQEEESKTIIFVETKRKVDDITRSISRYGWVGMKSTYSELLLCMC